MFVDDCDWQGHRIVVKGIALLGTKNVDSVPSNARQSQHNENRRIDSELLQANQVGMEMGLEIVCQCPAYNLAIRLLCLKKQRGSSFNRAIAGDLGIAGSHRAMF